ncbi:hypothetical protein FJZ27_05300 [Candidatus Peribacteria bacterium]|nr:hypothetical protein [Candidatus Peribacteria bacterium]
MTPFAALVGIREHRLIGRGDLRALGEDIDQFHLRADDPIAAVGAVPMALAAGVTKVGNAIVGELSDAPPERLGNGPLKYMERDVRSTISNVLNFGKNVLTFRPVKAVGNAIKGHSMHSISPSSIPCSTSAPTFSGTSTAIVEACARR